MKGFIFRAGVSIKEFGERNKADGLIRLGLKIRDYIRSLK